MRLNVSFVESAHRDPEEQQPRASGALFPKEASGSGDAVQGKLVTMVVEDDEDAILAAPVTLRDSEIKKRPKKAAKPRANRQQLRATCEDPQAYKIIDDTAEDMDEEEDLLVGLSGNLSKFSATTN